MATSDQNEENGSRDQDLSLKWKDYEFTEDVNGMLKNILNAEKNTYFPLASVDAIEQCMKDSIQRANEKLPKVAQLSTTTTTLRILLSRFGWDEEKLLDTLKDKGHSELLTEAVADASNRILNLEIADSTSSGEDNNSEEKCNICCLSKQRSLMYGMECGHRFCMDCWNKYLSTKITEEGVGQAIECAAHNCRKFVADDTVLELLTDSSVKLKYQRFITDGFVQSHPLIRWCPSPGCTIAICLEHIDGDWRPLTCSCGCTFCFDCGLPWHGPVRCDWIQKWLEKCNEDPDSFSWIATNTKECPTCSVRIEKNEGCDHMTCKNQTCSAQFCWLCLGPWASGHTCSQDSEARRVQATPAKVRSSTQRYVHFLEFYMKEKETLKGPNLHVSVKNTISSDATQNKLVGAEVHFLKQSVHFLQECRQTLMHSYVFAFYTLKNTHSVIFEENQQALQIATKDLSDTLRSECSSQHFTDIKEKVSFCGSLRALLLDHVYEGYEKNWWAFQDFNEED